MPVVQKEVIPTLPNGDHVLHGTYTKAGVPSDISLKIKVEEGGVIYTDDTTLGFQINGVVLSGVVTIKLQYPDGKEVEFEGNLDKEVKIIKGTFKSTHDTYGNEGDFTFNVQK